AMGDAGRHSGRVLEVTDRTLVLEEMGPWLGPNTGLVRWSVSIAPGTTVRLVTSTGQWEADDSPGYTVQPMDLGQLKVGDFVTVVTGSEGRGARSVEVVRPNGAAGLASPGAR